MGNLFLNDCINRLKEITGKKYIYFTSRGNSSIKEALKYARENFETIYYPDQAGWMTYKQFAEKYNFKINTIKTDIGLIENNYFKNVNKKACLLFNSMPAYAFNINVDNLNFKGLIINDVSGSIGSIGSNKGDFLVGSFGRWKPINLGGGGFIATDFDDFKIDNNLELDFEKLLIKLNNLENRLNFIKTIRGKVKNDLKNFEILYPVHDGLNVIVKFNDDIEKEKLINYCLENNLEYVLCPKDIRVNIDAISIEIKRLDENKK